MELCLSVEQKCHLGRIAAKQFLAITDNWQITDAQRRILIGAATRTTISTWRKRVNTLAELQLGNDTYERIICISAIQRLLLQKMDETDIVTFLRQPIEHLNNTSLLQKLLNGWMIDLYDVKDYLEKDSLSQHAPFTYSAEQTQVAAQQLYQ